MVPSGIGAVVRITLLWSAPSRTDFTGTDSDCARSVADTSLAAAVADTERR